MTKMVRLVVSERVDIKPPDTCSTVCFKPKVYEAVRHDWAQLVEKTGKGKIMPRPTNTQRPSNDDNQGSH